MPHHSEVNASRVSFSKSSILKLNSQRSLESDENTTTNHRVQVDFIYTSRNDSFDPEVITHRNDDFLQTQWRIQQNRTDTLRAACSKHKHDKRLTLGTSKHRVDHSGRFIVDGKHKLILCSVPKIASTNWRLYFGKLSGIVPPSSRRALPQEIINTQLKRSLRFLNHFNPDEAHKMLDNSLTFMFSRHPFSRVLSAFRNKLAPSSTFKMAKWWQNGLGWPIMFKYRNNGKLSLTEFKNRNKYDLRFSEFVRYLGDDSADHDNGYHNVHWEEIYRLCSPCDIDYDVIGKLETLDTDVKFILQLANLSDFATFSNQESSSPTYSSDVDTLERYMKDVPPKDVLSFYKRYRFDFELFGYELPAVSLRKIADSNLRIPDVV